MCFYINPTCKVVLHVAKLRVKRIHICVCVMLYCGYTMNTFDRSFFDIHLINKSVVGIRTYIFLCIDCVTLHLLYKIILLKRPECLGISDILKVCTQLAKWENLFSNVSVAYSYHHQGMMTRKQSCI